MRSASSPVLALALVLAACDGDPSGAFVLDADGSSSLETTVSFGPVMLGERAVRALMLRNRADHEVEIVSIASDPVDGPFRAEEGVFRIPPGADRALQLTFEPVVAGEARAVFSLEVRGGTNRRLTAHVRGRGFDSSCLIETQRVDFGQVATGTRAIETVRIRNGSDQAWDLQVGSLPGTSSFGFVEGAPGTRRIAARATLAIPVSFEPQALGVQSASLELWGPPSCRHATIDLTGEAVDQVLVWEPERLDFGYVPVGGRAVRTLTFRNLGRRDLLVAQLRLQQPADAGAPFSLVGGLDRELPAGSTAEVQISFAPERDTDNAGTLLFVSDDDKRRSGEVPLVGVGRGPVLELTPAALAFGRIALGTRVTRTLRISNAGTDAPGTSEDELRVDLAWDEGLEGGGFSLESPATTGHALAAGDSLEVRVGFEAGAAGPRSALLRVMSNDPERPQVEIPLTAEAVAMPLCDYEIVGGPRLDFGAVPPGGAVELPVVLRNTASGTSGAACEVTVLGIGAGFALAGEIEPGTQLAPGDVLELPVRYEPAEDGVSTGALELYVTAAASHVRIELRGGGHDPCLTLEPAELDFGPRGAGCASNPIELVATNVCSAPLELTAIGLREGWAPRFGLEGLPALPLTLGRGEEVRFQARFQPATTGELAGAITLTRTGAAGPVDRVIPMRGTGATTNMRTEVHALPARPPADILVIVSDAPSMADDRTRVAQNLAALFTRLQDSSLDFRLAVTTTSDDDAGRFMPLSGATPRVIEPTTPDGMLLFLQNADVGSLGDAAPRLIGPVQLALSEPNRSGHNAGFLRDEASLQVLVIADCGIAALKPPAWERRTRPRPRAARSSGPRRRRVGPTSPVIQTRPALASATCRDMQVDCTE